jgi:ABC-type transport system substrate-binding protein
MSCAAIIMMTGCSNGNSSDGTGYTYNTYLSTSPTNWNVHNWQTSDESYITSFTEIGLYDTILNSTKDGYEFVTEMASEMPIAVDPTTISDDDIEKYYSTTGNVASGMVWDIKLNQSAVWEDGTQITAQDYVDSMERQLSPSYVNFRADSYYQGNLVLANAESYYKQGRTTIEPAYSYLDTTTGEVPDEQGFWYINLGRYSPYAKSVFSNLDDDSSTFYTVLNNRSSKSTAAVELAAQRITHGVADYLWKYVDHTNADDKADWAVVTKPSDVKSTMFKNQTDIDLQQFDDQEVYTTKNIDDSSWEESNQVRYTQDMLKKDILTVVSTLGRGGSTSKSWAWKYPLFTKITNEAGANPITMADVGIKKVDEYTFRLYLTKSITNLNLKFALSGNWLVNTALYDKLTITLPTGSKSTTYATNSVSNYMSYGPYKLTGFESGKRIVMTRNDKWYGYTDGKHEGQFQMTGINTTIIKDHTTAINEFAKGQLDDIDLTVDDMSTYGHSGRRSTTYESYTQKISFNTNRDKLASRQSGSSNKTILANNSFRKGLSLSFDRNDFAASSTSGSKGFTGLLNDLYLANVATGESYRSTKQGKSVYGLVYDHLGGDTLTDDKKLSETACGYNKNLAAAYVAQGIEEELNSTVDGHLAKGNTIDIEFRVYDDSSATTKKMYNFINTAWTSIIDAAKAIVVKDGALTSTSDLSFNLSMVKDEDYYTTASNGGYDMIFSTWGGAAINPYGLMEVYCSKTFTSTCEYGFKGKQDTVNIDIDENGDGVIDPSTENKSFNAWYSEMTDTLVEPANSDELQPGDSGYEAWNTVHEKKLNVLAGLEAGIINRFEAIPLVARGTSSLLGFKVENATNTYVSLIGYGGIRFMTFNYNDSQWSDFVNQHGGKLADLYASYTE